MTDYKITHREHELPPQDIDDLIFADQTDRCVSDR